MFISKSIELFIIVVVMSCRGLDLHPFFISNTFISKTRLKLAKNQANATQHHEADFCYLLIIHIVHHVIIQK